LWRTGGAKNLLVRIRCGVGGGRSPPVAVVAVIVVIVVGGVDDGRLDVF
jgi:hypothetical protein